MIFVAFALLVSETSPFKRNVEVDVLGAGNFSCASAFSPEYYDQTFAWIMGYWTGVGMARGARSPLQTDGAGVVGEVKKLCNENPSMRLVEANSKTYLRFLRQ